MLLWFLGAAILVLGAVACMLRIGAVNRARRIKELGLEPRFAELRRLYQEGKMDWSGMMRTRRVELRLAEYEDEIRGLDVPAEQVALFEPNDDAERKALETLAGRGVLERRPEGKGYVLRRRKA